MSFVSRTLFSRGLAAAAKPAALKCVARPSTLRVAARNFSSSRAQWEVIKRFTEDHEWVSLDTDSNLATIGITKYAADALGDVVYVELPEVGAELEEAGSIGTVESVKSASDIYTPAGGVVEEVNTALSEKPALMNRDAEGEGWIVKIKVEDQAFVETLMDGEAYEDYKKGQDEKDE